jgi:membrane protease YdiL (CAAX protease family)
MVRSPFLWLLLYSTATVLVGGLLAWPLSISLGPMIDAPFHRVLNRTLVLTAVVGLLVLLRATGGMSRAEMGFASDRRSFLRLLAVNFPLGLLVVVPLAVMLVAIGARTSGAASVGQTLQQLVTGAPAALLIGITVGLSEEAYFRGVVMGAALRRGHPRSALLATSSFFAVVHFLVPRAEPEPTRWYSGLQLVAEGLSELTSPATLGAFLALAAGGLLLGAMRLRHGHIGSCAGLHAGWVTGYTLAHRLTDVTGANRTGWLVGPDGVLGWLAFVWIGAVAIVYVLLGPRRF